MTSPLLLPTSQLVGEEWIRRAMPGVGVGDALPEPSDATATVGFVRVEVVGGTPARDLPWRAPVVVGECWVSPAQTTLSSQWQRAEQLAERLIAATQDDALMQMRFDFAGRGRYAPARVTTVIALGEPSRVDDDPNGWARIDVDLLTNWVRVA